MYLNDRIARLERQSGLATYTFYTYEEYYVNEDNTQYGVGGGNYSGWRRRKLSESKGLSREQADAMCARARSNGNRYYQMEQE